MRKKGSMTVEAAFVVPLSFFAVMLFLNLFLFLQVQVRVQKEMTGICSELMSVGTLLSEAKTNSDSVGNRTDSDTNSLGIANLLRQIGTEEFLSSQMQSRLGTEKWVSHIYKGAKGFSFTGSEVYENGMEIRIRTSYSYSFANPAFSVGNIPVVQQIVARGFSGRERTPASPTTGDQDEEETIKVFVTETGSVFHRSAECTYLKLSIQKVSLEDVISARNSSGGKYYPCEICDKLNDEGNRYITDYGTRYHLSLSCPELLRTVSAITEEEAVARGLRACSKCGNKE